MELGDFGGGVGVLLRDGDSLGAEMSEKRSEVNGVATRSLLRWRELNKFSACFYVIYLGVENTRRCMCLLYQNNILNISLS